MQIVVVIVYALISIHALLTESDQKSSLFTPLKISFLSTLSLRRATWNTTKLEYNPIDFYPRSPYGERLLMLNGILRSFEISIHALLTESDGCWHP